MADEPGLGPGVADVTGQHVANYTTHPSSCSTAPYSTVDANRIYVLPRYYFDTTYSTSGVNLGSFALLSFSQSCISYSPSLLPCRYWVASYLALRVWRFLYAMIVYHLLMVEPERFERSPVACKANVLPSYHQGPVI